MPNFYFSSSILIIVLLCAPALSSAAGYLGVDGAAIDVESRDDSEINPRGLRLKLGGRLARNVDIEVHLGSGHDSHIMSYDKFRTTFAGIYLKGYLPIGQRSALFGLIGGAGVDLTQTIDGRHFSDGRSGFSYGIGLETEISARLDLSGDYIRYSLDESDYPTIETFSLGLKWYF